uniref:Uncharacterized protein n=1 Tax=Romanomermis culicivorax TaxID=13658 RepID=A0A915JS00_ROMCU
MARVDSVFYDVLGNIFLVWDSANHGKRCGHSLYELRMARQLSYECGHVSYFQQVGYP